MATERKRKVVTIPMLLARDDVKKVVTEFIAENLAETKALFLIWIGDDDKLYFRGCGLSDIEALGILEKTKAIILEEDE